MAFFDLSPRGWMITPHDTAQYGQVLRVSVVRETLKARISALALERSKASAAAPPTVVAFRKLRRESSTRYLLCRADGRGSYRGTYAPAVLHCQALLLDAKRKRMLDHIAVLQRGIDDDRPRHAIGGRRFRQLKPDDAADRSIVLRLHAEQFLFVAAGARDCCLPIFGDVRRSARLALSDQLHTDLRHRPRMALDHPHLG